MKLPVGYKVLKNFDGDVFHIAHITGPNIHGAFSWTYISSGKTEREAMLDAHNNTLFHDLMIDLHPLPSPTKDDKEANDLIRRIAGKL